MTGSGLEALWRTTGKPPSGGLSTIRSLIFVRRMREHRKLSACGAARQT
jgi:hypothetical protein